MMSAARRSFGVQGLARCIVLLCFFGRAVTKHVFVEPNGVIKEDTEHTSLPPRSVRRVLSDGLTERLKETANVGTRASKKDTRSEAASASMVRRVANENGISSMRIAGKTITAALHGEHDAYFFERLDANMMPKQDAKGTPERVDAHLVNVRSAGGQVRAPVLERLKEKAMPKQDTKQTLERVDAQLVNVRSAGGQVRAPVLFNIPGLGPVDINRILMFVILGFGCIALVLFCISICKWIRSSDTPVEERTERKTYDRKSAPGAQQVQGTMKPGSDCDDDEVSDIDDFECSRRPSTSEERRTSYDGHGDCGGTQ